MVIFRSCADNLLGGYGLCRPPTQNFGGSSPLSPLGLRPCFMHTKTVRPKRVGVEQAMKNWEVEKFSGATFLQLPSHYYSLPHLLEAHAFFAAPAPTVEAMMHDVTIMSLKAIGLQLSVGTVLTSRQIR